MAHIDGPLHAEALGDPDAPPMVFVHPNPMDNSGWLYQMAHFSAWYRCVAVDLPGYGRSPRARPGLTMVDVAEACWEAADRFASGARAVLVGCSVGGNVVQHMYHVQPARTDAVVMSGSGWREVKDFAQRRIAAYAQRGLDYRYDYALECFSAEFRSTPLARWIAGMFAERNAGADLETILLMFHALAAPDPDWLAKDLAAPVLIMSGSEDFTNGPARALHERLPDSEFVEVMGAGHACQCEQPWVFDAEMMRFLRAHGHEHLPG
ncbi:MAG: alpha/beta fold hydrolase [Actinomycetota bacterium]|nr:alpha/beta fold hydrolase [Actinomycetota bacterium]